MRLPIRAILFLAIVAAAAVGNSATKTRGIAVVPHGTVPGPTPYCNPFTQVCPVIR